MKSATPLTHVSSLLVMLCSLASAACDPGPLVVGKDTMEDEGAMTADSASTSPSDTAAPDAGGGDDGPGLRLDVGSDDNAGSTGDTTTSGSDPISLDLGGGGGAGAGAACDPLLQDCQAGWGCYQALDDEGFVCRQTEPDAGGSGASCSNDIECEAGHICVSDGGSPPSPTCRRYCDTFAPDCPNLEDQCLDVFDPNFWPEYASAGYCDPG